MHRHFLPSAAGFRQEVRRLRQNLPDQCPPRPAPPRLNVHPAPAEILPHPVLLKRFEEKVADLRTALNGKTIRTEAWQVIDDLIENVTMSGRDRSE